MKGKRFLRVWVFGALAGLVLLGMPDGALAGTTGKVTGSVKDAATQEAIAGAVIVVEEISRGGVTDGEGDYFIINLPPGEYSVTASIIGYEKITKKGVGVNADRTITVNFELKTAAIELAGVVVEMEREVVPMDVSASQAVVTSEEMSQSVSKNVSEALSLEPAVYNGQVRGGGTDETLLLMDGMRMVDERMNEAYMGINATAIEQVQINTGGFNAEYGNLRSGLFNVVTREGNPGQLSLFLNYRFSPAAKKHFGSDAYGDHTTEWQTYAQDHGLGRVWDEGGQFLFEGSADAAGNIPLLDASGAVVTTVAPDNVPSTQLWKGWNQVAADLAGNDNADDDMTAKEAQALWKWQHREIDYADAADQNLDATIIGTIPGLDDLKFLVSHRFEDTQFATPQPRDGFKDQNTQLKLDYVGLENWKITGSYLRGTMESLGQAGRAWAEFGSASYADVSIMRDNRPSYLTRNVGITPSGGWQGTDASTYGSIIGPRNKYNIAGSVVDRTFTQMGLTVKNIVSDATYWDVSFQSFAVDYELGPSATRDLTVVERNVDGVVIMADETPYGHFTNFGVDQTGTYNMDVEYGGRDSSEVTTTVLAGNITSQINKFHQIKTGVEMVLNNLDEQSGQIVVYRSEAQFKDAAWDPQRFSAYLQDRLEIEGMIANFGARLEYWNANTDRYFPDVEENFFGDYADLPGWYGDRLAPKNWSYADHFEEWAESGQVTGADGAVIEGLEPPPSRAAKTYWRLSPRLGISFPISEAGKIYFNYGHFYTSPRSRHTYGFFGASGRQFFNWMGNPDLKPAQTVAYEVGYDHNIANTYHLHLAGYVKDSRDMPDFTMYFPSTRTAAPTGISENKLYSDIRGFEAKLAKRRGRFLTGWVNFNYQIESRGLVGFERIQQDPRELDVRSTTGLRKSDPIPSIRASIDFHTPAGWGQEIVGIHPFENVSLNWLQWWSRGQKATWDPGQSGRIVDNVRWKDILNTDLRISKTFEFGGIRPVLFADIANLFNRRLINSGAFRPEEWTEYMESLNFDSEGQGGSDRIGDWDKSYIELPDEEWGAFINPRDIFIGLNLNMDFSLR